MLCPDTLLPLIVVSLTRSQSENGSLRLYHPPIGRQQPDLGPGSRPATAWNPKIGFGLPKLEQA